MYQGRSVLSGKTLDLVGGWFLVLKTIKNMFKLRWSFRKSILLDTNWEQFYLFSAQFSVFFPNLHMGFWIFQKYNFTLFSKFVEKIGASSGQNFGAQFLTHAYF